MAESCENFHFFYAPYHVSAKYSRCGGNKRGWCNFIDEGGGAATDDVAYLTVGDVLTVQLSSFLATKIKVAKTSNFICSSTIKVLVEQCCQAW